ncbi:MAG: carbamoyltransferase HypF, partial [Planctomycetota bacterium]
VLEAREDALIAAADAIRQGRILALKGLGGFQLIADARRSNVVAELRRRKHREEKPLAIMVPSVAAADALCAPDRNAIRVLCSPQAPIVLAPRRSDAHPQLAENVAPRSPRLGVMLPYTPLHHLLMRELGFPVVATSGNRSDEPICIDSAEALRRLEGIADLFLTHNRPIVRHVDDSVVQIVCDEPVVLRRARGFAPAPVEATTAREPVLAVGAHQKNTVALAAHGNIFLSQHVGDLTTSQAADAFEQAARDLPALYEAPPRIVVCDLHPDYYSSRRAAEWSAQPQRVQHHHAHIAACLAEHRRNELALGVAWDGAGLGLDGTIWGGEFLRGDLCAFERAAHLDCFPLPGGELAAREPRRSALGVLFATFGEAIFEHDDWPPIAAFRVPERRVLRAALRRDVNCPLTSAAGRLFDAVASMLDIRQRVRYEGQAAMELEYAAAESDDEDAYPFELPPSQPQRIDWRPLIRALLADRERGAPRGVIARRFHNTLVDVIAAIAQRFGETTVVLSGGCFQNTLLLSSAIERLKRLGREPLWPRRIPPNDGGVALGQAVVACIRSGGPCDHVFGRARKDHQRSG